MRTVDDIIQSSIDQMVREQSSFFEGEVRPYLPAISKRLQEDLDASGYQIVAKPGEKTEHLSGGGRHHGR